MSEIVERNSLDLRYQGYRLRNDAREARLLASIAERGIEQPLRGIDAAHGRLLLDGFKRQRCADKLHIECVPYVSLGEEEAEGIINLMRLTEQKTLTILEQARFVAELLSIHDMTVADVAQTLSRSKAWVSLRHGLLKEISPVLQEILFRGRFPVYSYMVTLRPFMRINNVTSGEIERFVQAVAGQDLSVRQIELLTHGYFRGPASLRQAIDEGKWKWSLSQMQAAAEDPEGCNDFERSVLRDLEQLLKLLGRLMTRSHDRRLQTRPFHAQANLLLASLLSRRDSFFTKMEEFHDRSGHASCRFSVAPGGDVAAPDQPPLAHQPQCRAGDRQAGGKADSQTAQRQAADRS